MTLYDYMLRGSDDGRRSFRGWIFLVGVLAAPVGLHGADTKAVAASATPVQANAQVIKWTPEMRVGTLTGRANSDVVEFDGGRRIRVGDLRRLDAAAKRIRAAASGGSALRPGLSATPAASGERISNASELAARLGSPGTETLQLPSGRTLTAEQLRFLQPEVEKRLGRKLTASPTAPVRSGPAIRVPRGVSAEAWGALMQKPGDTVLESPSGRRATVGEIKQQLAAARARQPAAGRATETRR